MGGFMDDGERAARGWRLAARIGSDAPSPLETEVAGRRVLVFHGALPAAGDADAPGDALQACVVVKDCPACGRSRAAAASWQVRDPDRVRCPGCGGEASAATEEPGWPVMCVDDEVYVYVEEA